MYYYYKQLIQNWTCPEVNKIIIVREHWPFVNFILYKYCKYFKASSIKDIQVIQQTLNTLHTYGFDQRILYTNV